MRSRSKLLARPARKELCSLQTEVRELAVRRNSAFRLFVTSRSVAIDSAQRELWWELVWVDQEYRCAVRRLAQFCTEHRNEFHSFM